jgi:putative nucleotidyltransferase with HDIG domain
MLVVGTAVLLTAVTALAAPPIPFRGGEVSARDIRARVAFTVINEAQTEQRREEWLDGGKVRAAVPPVVDKYPAGTPLVKRGQPISVSQIGLLLDEDRAFRKTRSALDMGRDLTARFGMHLLLCVLIALYISRFQPALGQNLPRLAGMCGQAVLTVALALLLSRAPWHAGAVPLTLTIMIFTAAFNPPFALLMAFTLSLVTNVATDGGADDLLVNVAGLATVALLLRNVFTRSRVVRVSAVAGLAAVAMTVADGLLTEQTARLIALDGCRALSWAILAGFILMGSLPLVERFYGVVTDVTLLELADTSHPLLQELIRRAPGTYTHSATMATLAESAAEAIGANPLLTRVGCYYHDIGKMLKPHYFIENQTGENPHDRLEPALSTLIIVGHVKDGVALAQQYRLPRPVVDFIHQHHGTTLVEYFYREALRIGEENGHGTRGLEHAFRYPGPKPSTREIGIVMLADAVESASRALPSPTAGSLRKLVHDLVMKRLLDGQFDDSGLTLTELRRIEESLCKGVTALFHVRIRYPEPSAAAA